MRFRGVPTWIAIFVVLLLEIISCSVRTVEAKTKLTQSKAVGSEIVGRYRRGASGFRIESRRHFRAVLQRYKRCKRIYCDLNSCSMFRRKPVRWRACKRCHKRACRKKTRIFGA